MSFSNLPPAILSLIASQLREDDLSLASYATINKSWQSVVEALTFREIRTESIEHLQRVPEYMNRDRWDAMRSLDVIVHLPEYERERWYTPETDDDKRINNALFSDFMRKLFETVNTWEKYRDSAPRFTLAIQAISMSDYWHLGRLNRMKRYANTTRGAEDVRIQASYLRLTGDLPSLSAVSGLVVRGARNVRIIRPGRSCCPRLLSGESVCRIVKACPNVGKVEIELSDQESKYIGLRNAERSAFAMNFTGLPQGLRQLRMSYPGVVPANQLFSPPSIPSSDDKDLLSYRLNMISQQLQFLEVKAVLSDDFFDITSPATSWPLLQSLSIDFNPCTTSGDWMLELDPIDSDIEPDHEREYEFEGDEEKKKLHGVTSPTTSSIKVDKSNPTVTKELEKMIENMSVSARNAYKNVRTGVGVEDSSDLSIDNHIILDRNFTAAERSYCTAKINLSFARPQLIDIIMSKPVLILSPGAWHPAEVYGKLVPHLEAEGYKTVLHDWPSIQQAPVKSFDEDIQAIRTAVLSEADAGNDVVIIAHSWSGSPVNSSVADLSKAERTKQGKPGGIVKLIFLCAFVVPQGVSLLDALGGDENNIPLWNVQGDVVHANDPAHFFFQGLSEDEQKQLASLLKPHSKTTFCDPSRGAAYMTIPSAYLICEDDAAIPVFAQEAMVKHAQEAGAPLTSERLKSAHSPFLTHPQETAKFCIRALT
ncbi:alpha/beta-hydrolase, partial [Aureobasidium melanogenum]